MSFKKTITIHAGYDRRDSGGGVHGAELVLALMGENGAVTFAVQTEWVPALAGYQQANRRPSSVVQTGMYPKPLDSILHFDRPLYTAQKHEHDSCPYMPDGMACYSMRINGQSVKWRDALLDQGSDYLWRLMAIEYNELARNMGTARERIDP